MRELVATVRSRYVAIRDEFVGFHRWFAAPDEVMFLRDFHRHLFKVRVVIEVGHGDRQVEFFTAQKTLRSILRKEFEDKKFDLSCEMIAEEVGKRMAFNCYAVHVVEVSEDGENSGQVHFDTHERNSGEPQDLPVKLSRAPQHVPYQSPEDRLTEDEFNSKIRKTYRPKCQVEDTAPLD